MWIYRKRILDKGVNLLELCAPPVELNWHSPYHASPCSNHVPKDNTLKKKKKDTKIYKSQILIYLYIILVCFFLTHLQSSYIGRSCKREKQRHDIPAYICISYVHVHVYIHHESLRKTVTLRFLLHENRDIDFQYI